jgi:hypothetical protein
MSAIASIAEISDLCEIADMPGETSNELYDRLVAVKPDGLSFNAWALKAGVNRTIFSDARKRGNLTHDSLTKLLDAIDVSWAEFDAGGEPRVKTEVAASGLSVKDVERAWRGLPRARPVPLLGSAMGGEWDGDTTVEMTELHLSEVFDYLARPPSVEHDPRAYAITIVGDSMAPRFEPGERAIASPRASVSIGDDAIVQLRGEDSDRIALVLIKRIVRRTADFVELRQFNPHVNFRVPMARVAAIHRVMGRI